jgi:signal transduction histidine kinase
LRDDGVGAESQALNAPRSYGVMGMRERAAQFGGRLAIDSAPGHGTLVRLWMPLHPATATGGPVGLATRGEAP